MTTALAAAAVEHKAIKQESNKGAKVADGSSAASR